MTPDPLAGDISNPQSLNRYAHALNNPTTLIDPLGLDSNYKFCTYNLRSAACGNDARNSFGPPGIIGFGGFDEFDLAAAGLLPSGVPAFCAAEFESCVGTTGGRTIGFGLSGIADYPDAVICAMAQEVGCTWGVLAFTANFGGSLPGNLPTGTPKIYWKPFKQAFKTALKDLKNPGCSEFFGGGGPATMLATEYRFVPLPDASTGAETVSPTSVFINSGGPFMTFTSGSQVFGMSWKIAQFRAFILLHELGHQLSDITGFQPDAGSLLNEAQSAQVIAACF